MESTQLRTYLDMLVRQNDEIIRLLTYIAEEDIPEEEQFEDVEAGQYTTEELSEIAKPKKITPKEQE